MNERHEQLLAQAHVEFAPDSKAVTKRFAELIVGECLGIIDEEGSHEGGSIRSMEAIKEHFGVEE